MAGRQILRIGAVFALAAVLASCDETATAPSNGKGFKTQYLAARAALEGGNYAKANRAYAKLLPTAGPLKARIQLEYAHSLLRGGELDKAAAQATALVQSETGLARGAALAVQATALHEQGLLALSQGDSQTGKARLVAAKGAMDDVLKTAPQLDPLGALAGRRASIEVRLKAL